MNAYVDSSAYLRRLLNQPGAIPDMDRWERAYSSRLLRTESLRTAHRLRLEGKIDDATLSLFIMEIESLSRSIHLLPLDDDVLEQAGRPYPTVVGTLDAIHLATALTIRERGNDPIAILTHDIQLGAAARAHGFPVEGI